MNGESYEPPTVDGPPPILARPACLVYAARPMAVERAYPESDMSRGAALLDIVIAVVGLFVLLVGLDVGGVFYYIAERFSDYGPLWSNVIIGVLSIGLVAGILLLRRQRPHTVGLRRLDVGRVAAGLAAVPGCYLALIAAAASYMGIFGFDPNAIIEQKQDLISVIPEFSITTVLLFGVLTGIHEELLFRGLLLTRLNALTGSRAAGILISAVLFGLVHDYQGGMGMVQTGAIGLVLGIVVTLTRSIWPAIIAHATFNSLQLAALPHVKDLLDQIQQGATTLPA